MIYTKSMLKTALLYLALFLLLFFVPVSAQVSDENELNAEEPCIEIVNRLEESQLNYSVSSIEHLEKYQILWLKVGSLVSKADLLEYETEDLQENLDELENLIEQFTEGYSDLDDAINTTKNLACQGTELSYSNSLREVRQSLKNLRDIARDTSSLYSEEITNNILSLEKLEIEDETQ